MVKKLAVLAVVLCAPVMLAAQSGEKKPVIKKAGAPITRSSDGQQMFNSYCSPCHGRSGKGDGPAATALTPKPADLTQLTKNHGGAFPSKDFEDKLNGMAMSRAHGSTEMPVWGPILREMGNDQMRVFNLKKYVETLQAH
jgi:mono/diheme cytochrome c family protein